MLRQVASYGGLLAAPGEKSGEACAGAAHSTARPSVLERWYALTAPSDPGRSATAEQRNRMLQGRILSALLLCTLIALLVLSPWEAPSATAFSSVVIGVITVISLYLNRQGKVGLAGVVVVTGLEITLMAAILRAPGFVIGVTSMESSNLLVGPVLIAATVLTPASVLIVTGVNCVFFFGIAWFAPHSPTLSLIIHHHGFVGLAHVITIQIFTTAVGIIWAHTNREALQRADRAEEIATLRREEAARKRELEDGVRTLVNVHAHLSNGNFRVRVPQLRDPALWQLGVSTNTLISRLARFAHAEWLLQREDHEAHRLAEAIYRRQDGYQATLPSPSGIPLDVVLAALARAEQAQSFSQENYTSPGMAGIEREVTGRTTHPLAPDGRQEPQDGLSRQPASQSGSGPLGESRADTRGEHRDMMPGGWLLERGLPAWLSASSDKLLP